MRISALKHGQQPAVKNGNLAHFQDLIKRRLKEVESFNFARLDCDGNLHLVGESIDIWEPQELEDASARLESLALDPSRGLKLQAGGVEEAVVALQAENLGVFERLEREETGGAEFADEHGVEWDVKSPLSPSPDHNWKFSPHHQLKKVRRDFSQGDKVLLNLTRVSEDDRDQTLRVLHDSLSCSERENLLILSDATGHVDP
jgi:hypothetical protein